MDLITHAIQVSWNHRVVFTDGVFNPGNTILRDVLAGGSEPEPAEALVVLDGGLEKAQPRLAKGITTYFSAHAASLRLRGPALVRRGGEAARNSWPSVSGLHAAINDFQLLASFRPRDKRAGYADAVKVACIRDRDFFQALEREAGLLCRFEPGALRRLIRRCAELHLEHITRSGDPFESGPARPLDFGQWATHKLEHLARFRLRHGEAVAIGIALDVICSRHIGSLPKPDAERILGLLFERFNVSTLTVHRLTRGDLKETSHRPVGVMGLEFVQ